MKHADQGEQPPRGVEIHVDLAVQGFPQQLGRVVVKRAAGHVDRLDPVRAVGADRFEIAVANGEIVADRPTEAGEAEANGRSEEHTSELQSLMRISYAVFCLNKKKTHLPTTRHNTQQRDS